ncbi:very-long-chain enoyl-coa reductase [Plakobranchus ocellatus]|uniref:Very-long-chain enoyl-coa reductase n=1 Tax=Plakobranchus ocellatus TaxID=259542 RepID=A0AAV3XY54_9GAST|nr:very-long-chain enoyl-coa reductase [Plakobranchus ocellatus]
MWKPTTRKRNNSCVASRNRELLGRDSETTKKYTTHLSELLSENDPSQSAKYQWDYVKQSIETAVNTNISETPRQKTFKIYDKEIQDLSELQKKLWIKIQNSKQTNKTECPKKEGNCILHRIHKRTKELRDKHLQQLVEDIDKSSSDGAKVLNATEVKVNITGIDMSAAFDTINRTKLLEILRDIIDEDELRIIRFLLSETTIDVKINGANDLMPFTTNIGTPQGDSLSPVLFIVILNTPLGT